uniref:FISUMP domain-containing protein n=1 Tax=uncultured Fibrobacter sp. TaxID=261512 RepID=UPI0025E77D3A
MRFIVAMFLVTLLLAACGDDNKNAGGTVEDGEVVAIVDKTISGVSQKGPFVNGSSVTVQELNGKTLAQTGLGFEGKIKNDLGEFSVKVNKLESQYALLKANGYYRNEVRGDKSKGQVTLYALTDLSNRDEVNVNLLTHLAYERSLYLATVDTLSVAKAKKQAEAEIFKSFGIEGNFAAAEDLNIFGADDQSAALLAVSILMQSDLSEGDFSERLADYAADIESDGIWNDAKTATEIADWASNRSLTGTLIAIRNNIAGWGLSADVPAFEMYVNNFWWQNYGLGICDAKREGEVLKNQNTASVNANVYYICKSSLWQVASDIEKDTATWGVGKFDGEVRAGQVNETVYYIYETSGNAWRKATTLEKDTYDFTNNKDWSAGVDGEIKEGSVTDSVYVYDAAAWRVADEIEKVLGGCVVAIADSLVKVGSTYYICSPRKWVVATELQYDTYKQSCAEFGQIIHGNINADYAYFCYGKEWKRFYGNENITYGKLLDERDGQIYRTVKIGGQTWMAENLNYADSAQTPSLEESCWCYEYKDDNCVLYGCHYNWYSVFKPDSPLDCPPY